MADYLLHHLSGALFGVGAFAAWLGSRWMTSATKSLKEASAYYDRATKERIEATSKMVEYQRAVALAKVGSVPLACTGETP